ncbi:MAG: helix-turn-helix transcriptional regulator [Melioribacteraceae bacterium]|nr:MAG: helix-turn-helix transcriptional regulator [Melioribacteraceae bacterium]
MKIPREILILLCSIGAVQSYFLSYTFLKSKNKTSFVSYILSALFFMVGLRVTKSVLWAFWEGTPIWLINIGFAAHLAVGPLLFIYIYYSLKEEGKFSYLNYLHFIPAFLVLFLSFNLEMNSFWYAYAYSILLYHQVFYLLASAVLIIWKYNKNEEKQSTKIKMAWLRNLLIGITVWHFAYFSNYILGWTSYFLGPVLYSGIVYIISFFVYKNQNIFEEQIKTEKYKNINLPEEDIKKYITKIIAKVENENLYLDPNFTLAKLSESVSIPTYIISQVLNVKMEKNFSEFINFYRIEKAKILLDDPGNQNYKIANIAYDCGFNSLSAFNTAFKKNTNQTPSQYKTQK